MEQPFLNVEEDIDNVLGRRVVMANDRTPTSELEPCHPVVEDLLVREMQDVPIPFDFPCLLWRMKAATHAAKDAGKLVFLPHWFAKRGEEPPQV